MAAAPVPYWRLSGFYFSYFASLGVFIPYWNLYLEKIGLNSAQIGELSALLAATRIVAPNLWGWIADQTGHGLRIIQLLSFLAMVIFCGFLIRQDFASVLWLTIGFSFFWNATLPQYEAVTLFHLHNDSHRYSRIRLWGSIGFIFAVSGIGGWLDYYPVTLLPHLVLILLALVWLVAVITPNAKLSGHMDPVPQGVWQILKKPEVLVFLLVYMLLQLSHGPYYIFYSLYLKQLGYSAGVTGGLWALGVCAEIVVFVFMGKLLKRVSLRQMVLFSLFAATCRWLLIAWCADSLGWLMLAQLLHAATFGTAHVAAIYLIQAYFGRRHQNKGQALYSSVSFGIGGMLGSLLSGYGWEFLGALQVYSIAALVCVLAFALAFFGTPGLSAQNLGHKVR